MILIIFNRLFLVSAVCQPLKHLPYFSATSCQFYLGFSFFMSEYLSVHTLPPEFEAD